MGSMLSRDWECSRAKGIRTSQAVVFPVRARSFRYWSMVQAPRALGSLGGGRMQETPSETRRGIEITSPADISKVYSYLHIHPRCFQRPSMKRFSQVIELKKEYKEEYLKYVMTYKRNLQHGSSHPLNPGCTVTSGRGSSQVRTQPRTRRANLSWCLRS